MSVDDELGVSDGEMRAVEQQMESATRDYLRSLAEAKQALHEYRVEIEEERDDPRAQAEEQRLEREIRQGVHGAALKTLQERLDLNQTTMLDVFSGTDTHWSADGLRDLFGPVVEQAAAEERGDAPADLGDPAAQRDVSHLTRDDRNGTGEAPRRRIDEKGTW